MFKFLTGDTQPTSYSVKIKHSINFSYFDQMGGQFNDQKIN